MSPRSLSDTENGGVLFRSVRAVVRAEKGSAGAVVSALLFLYRLIRMRIVLSS